MSIIRTCVVLLGIGAFLWAGTTADFLANMDQSEKENAIIQLEWSGMPTEDMRFAESLWNAGRYAEAVSLIEEIEGEIDALAVAINYRNPIITPNPKWATDVLVNSTNYNLHEVELILADNGNLFIIARGDSSSSYRWFVHMSTDGGFNWAQTASWYGAASDIPSVDAGEMPTYVYVAYATASAATSARVRRVFESDGTMDAGYGYVNAIATTGSVREVNFEPNRFSQGEMYYCAIDASNRLYYSYSTDGQTWNGIATNVTNAERSLDLDYGFISGGGHYLWICYLTTADSLCARARTGGSWGVHNNIDNVHSSTYFKTGIGHHGDTVMIWFEDPSYRPRYRVTYNDGASWSTGTPYSDSAGAHDITGRGNDGWHVSFASWNSSGPEQVYYTSRTYHNTPWTTEELLGDHDEFINYKTSIDYLGSSGAYGVAYIDDNFDVYFDRLDWQAGVAEQKPANNNHFVTLAPDPSRDFTTLSYAINTQGHVKISVYDATGRLVENLVNDTGLAGTYTIPMNNQNLAAGVYFINIETEDGISSKKMTIVR